MVSLCGAGLLVSGCGDSGASEKELDGAYVEGGAAGRADARDDSEWEVEDAYNNGVEDGEAEAFDLVDEFEEEEAREERRFEEELDQELEVEEEEFEAETQAELEEVESEYGYRYEPSYEYGGQPTTEDFWSGNGYVVECQDGTLSDSGGIQGACSHHGG